MNQSGDVSAEQTPLLQVERRSEARQHGSDNFVGGFTRSPASVLPIALLSALALAATAVTQIYTYATMLCKDAHHCNESESRMFAASVAIATTVANACALFPVGFFEALCKRHTRLGLGTWITIRSFSVISLVLGVITQKVEIALSSHIFEGVASDNILHLNLNTLYLRTQTTDGTSKLIGVSLTLYMLGISLSPSIASLLSNFQQSFVMAYGLFVVALIYLMIVVRVPQAQNSAVGDQPGSENTLSARHSSPLTWAIWLLSVATSPLHFVTGDLWRLLPGMALFCSNTAQSYIFSALMVHTSVYFGFSSRENGFLLTIVHVIASIYLLTILLIAPQVRKLRERGENKRGDISSPSDDNASQKHDISRLKDGILAVISLLIQATALIFISFANQTWQIYTASAILGLGLACPGLIKAYFILSFEKSEKPKALAYLALMESCGSFIAPISIGGFQTLWPGRGIFVVATCVVGLASLLLMSGLALDWRRGSRRTVIHN
ncbi:hypothetical protein GGR57DRAFT_518171 [Xylariaceae sp. FL1272]|nr:hypothetical protein GGR57DRAFT_518171 [Xylariaceae sp. FL1272]